MDVPAGEAAYFVLPLPDGLAPGEYALRCGLCLREATPWAEAGFEQMTGEHVFVVEGVKAPEHSRADYRIALGDVNAGAHGAGFDVLLSYQDGGLISLKKDGLERIARAPRPNFDRAPDGQRPGQRHALPLRGLDDGEPRHAPCRRRGERGEWPALGCATSIGCPRRWTLT